METVNIKLSITEDDFEAMMDTLYDEISACERLEQEDSDLTGILRGHNLKRVVDQIEGQVNE